MHDSRVSETSTNPARQEGFEPPTNSLEGCRSIHLSYWRLPVATGHPPGHLATLPKQALLRSHEIERSHLPADRRRYPGVPPAPHGPTDSTPRLRHQRIGAAGFEPATSCSQSRRDTGLRYAPYIRSRAVYLRTPVRSTGVPHRLHSACSQPGPHLRQQRPEGRAPMTHRRLLLPGDFRERAPAQ